MRINWLGYQYRNHDGYGRYSIRMMAALERLGVEVFPVLAEHLKAPAWVQAKAGIDWSRMTVACLPPTYLYPMPGRTWLITMTEGSELPEKWAEWINASGVERVFVPCALNADTFRRGGVMAPVSVLPGGTDPLEFPVIPARQRRERYTFLALADRGSRKGWGEVWAAFYKAFGRPQDTPDVRLLIKSRKGTNDILELIAKAENPDPRVRIVMEDIDDVAQIYAQADVFAIPSRSEGYGMPHREAAMMGVPVLTQRYAGMDDGYTDRWAIVVEGGRMEDIPKHFESISGEWMVADVNALAAAMRRCYEQPLETAEFGRRAASWLRANQTWDHAARRLVRRLQDALHPGEFHVSEIAAAGYTPLMAQMDDGSELWR